MNSLFAGTGPDAVVTLEPKTVTRYDHGRESLEQNAVNFILYEVEK
jgi:hypothetical protein